MSRKLFVASLTTAVVLIAAGTPGRAEEPGKGLATLPLDDLLALREAAQRDEKAPRAPVPFALDEVRVRGRIVGEALDARASLVASVLEDGWVAVPLLELDADTDVTALPTLDDAHLVVRQGTLTLVTEKRGRYDFEVGLLQRARPAGGHFRAALGLPGATVGSLHLSHDEGLYRVLNREVRQDGDDLVLYARGGRLVLEWEALQPATVRAQARAPARPPIDPVVTSGVGSVVMTLDGQRIARYRYLLRFEGIATLDIAIPEGQSLAKVYLNDVSQPVAASARTVHLKVTPARPGEAQASLELVMREKAAPLPLAGSIELVLPGLSWGVSEMAVALHLPDVFTYDWQGGSLAPTADDAIDTPSFRYDIPTPGKVLTVRQELVQGEADVLIGFAVDLAGNFYR